MIQCSLLASVTTQIYMHIHIHTQTHTYTLINNNSNNKPFKILPVLRSTDEMRIDGPLPDLPLWHWSQAEVPGPGYVAGAKQWWFLCCQPVSVDLLVGGDLLNPFATLMWSLLIQPQPLWFWKDNSDPKERLGHLQLNQWCFSMNALRAGPLSPAVPHGLS